jgi:hypothetical protein
MTELLYCISVLSSDQPCGRVLLSYPLSSCIHDRQLQDEHDGADDDDDDEIALSSFQQDGRRQWKVPPNQTLSSGFHLTRQLSTLQTHADPSLALQILSTICLLQSLLDGHLRLWNQT